jgi:hypothetical protein
MPSRAESGRKTAPDYSESGFLAAIGLTVHVPACLSSRKAGKHKDARTKLVRTSSQRVTR